MTILFDGGSHAGMEGKEKPRGKLKNMEPECDPLEKGIHLYTTELYLWFHRGSFWGSAKFHSRW